MLYLLPPAKFKVYNMTQKRTDDNRRLGHNVVHNLHVFFPSCIRSIKLNQMLYLVSTITENNDAPGPRIKKARTVRLIVTLESIVYRITYVGLLDNMYHYVL